MGGSPEPPIAGGPEGIRTPDLLNAIQTRSQLRHRPACGVGARVATYPRVHHHMLRRRRVDTHALALVRQGLLKLDVPVDHGVERIVPAHAHVDTRLPARATLAEDDTPVARYSPPNFFTPSRFDWLSRPLRELPIPFL